jgi:hypothetical protein
MKTASIILSGLGGQEAIALIVIIAAITLPFRYLAFLQGTIKLTYEKNRVITPSSVWLALIPVLGLFFHITTIIGISQTLKRDFNEKGLEQDSTEFGKVYGLTYTISTIINFFLGIMTIIYIVNIASENSHFENQINGNNFLVLLLFVISAIANIVTIVCWIVYWVKMSTYKNILVNFENGTYKQTNNILTIQPIHRAEVTKKCPDCSTLVPLEDGFCIKCGFDFSKLPTPTILKLNENEKQCTECELILSKDATQCTRCGFPFPLNKTSNIQTPPPRAESKEIPIIQKVEIPEVNEIQKTKITQQIIEDNSNPNKTLYIVFGLALLLIIGGIVSYSVYLNKGEITNENTGTNSKEDEQIFVLQQNVNNDFKEIVQLILKKASLISVLINNNNEIDTSLKGIRAQITEGENLIKNAENSETLEAGNEKITQAITQALKLYPQIKEYPTFSSIEGTENRISVATTRYNDGVREYNIKIKDNTKYKKISEFVNVLQNDMSKETIQTEPQEGEIDYAAIEGDVKAKINQYYDAMQANNINATDYFAPNVIQYVTKKNITPTEINNLIADGSNEFTNSEHQIDYSTFEFDRKENGLDYYKFKVHFKCYRTSKKKTEECDISVEIGIGNSYQFVSYVESKIENLKFY